MWLIIEQSWHIGNGIIQLVQLYNCHLFIYLFAISKLDRSFNNRIVINHVNHQLDQSLKKIARHITFYQTPEPKKKKKSERELKSQSRNGRENKSTTGIVVRVRGRAICRGNTAERTLMQTERQSQRHWTRNSVRDARFETEMVVERRCGNQFLAGRYFIRGVYGANV